MVSERNIDGTFKRGTCPNPGGKPKGIRERVREACIKYGVDPYDFMASILTDKKASNKDKISVAIHLSERMDGKTVQYNDISIEEKGNRKFTVEFINND